ncbi:hypothetical protein Tco_0091061 [Tanacetum coccineum]
MDINSPCLTDKKELAIPGQTVTGKEFSNPLMAGSLPKTISVKFWNTATSKTVNTVKQIHVIVDNKAVVISESSVRSDLLFDDEDAQIEPILPSPTTYQQKRKTHKCRRTKKDTKLPQTSVPQDLRADEAVHKERCDSVERAITTDVILDAAQDSDNILKPRPRQCLMLIFLREWIQPNEPPLLEGHTSGSGEGSMEHTFELTDNVPPTPHDSPLTGGYTPGSDEGRLKLEELITIYTDLSNRGRNDDKTKELNLTDGNDTEVIIEDKGSGEKDGSTADQFSTARPDVSAATPTTTTIFDDDEDLTIAQTLVKMKSEKAKEKGVVLKDVEDNSRPVKSITTLQPLPTIDPKDKGKGILVEEPEKPEKVKRRDKGLAQIESDAKLAQRLYEEELAEVEKRQKERAKQEEASIAALYDEYD